MVKSQCCVPYHGNKWSNFLLIFATIRQLSDAFCFNWPYQNAGSELSGVQNCKKAERANTKQGNFSVDQSMKTVLT